MQRAQSTTELDQIYRRRVQLGCALLARRVLFRADEDSLFFGGFV
jgi:hypothetical protein